MLQAAYSSIERARNPNPNSKSNFAVGWEGEIEGVSVAVEEESLAKRKEKSRVWFVSGRGRRLMLNGAGGVQDRKRGYKCDSARGARGPH